jgi:hypothetical protein
VRASLVVVALVALAGCPRRTHAPPPRLTVDARGRVFDGAGVEVGFTDAAGQAFMGAARDGRPLPIDAARIGRLDGARPLYRLKPLTRGAHGLEPGDATVGALADGRAVLTLAGGRFAPMVAPPEGRRGRIELDAGDAWVSLRFATDADPVERARWVEPAHAAREIAERARELEAEAGRLPAPSRAAVERALPVMALISTVEGRFGDPATNPRDTAASLGIFQWAQARGRADDAGSSLERFFARLKTRALTRDPLARGAWRLAAGEGLDVRSDRLLLDGKRCSGGDVELRLKSAMGRAPLSTYQLIAALDWIADVRATVVRPGLYSRAHAWRDYSEADGGRTITLGTPRGPITLHAAAPATVGKWLASPRALAAAVNLGVNRPRFVESALWQALTPGGDATTRIAALLDDAAGQGRRARRARAALQAILWPAPPRDAPDGEALLEEFERRALGLYRAGDRERRARRLATELP